MHLISTSFNYLKLNEYVIVYVDLLILLLKPGHPKKRFLQQLHLSAKSTPALLGSLFSLFPKRECYREFEIKKWIDIRAEEFSRNSEKKVMLK